MNVVAIGPLPVESLSWQGPVNRVLTVICKATFTLRPGESPLHPVQQPINPADVFLDGDPSRSLQAPSDLVPYKARADVVLVGFAFAPRGEPVPSLVVRLVVGALDKAFEVVGDRTWTTDGALGEAARFTRQSLRYERAAGGPETSNPVGVSADSLGAAALPNAQPVGFVPARPGDFIAPVGFGPIASSWPGRRERLGQLKALTEHWNLTPLPAELDPAYFNCAPRDQQLDRLREDERFVLENLHPQHPRLVSGLPRVRPRAFADRGEGLQEVAMAADTLWIDTGAGICTLTWRGHVESPTTNGIVVVAMESPTMPLPWAEIQAAAQPVTAAAPPSGPTAPIAPIAPIAAVAPIAPPPPLRRAVTLLHVDTASVLAAAAMPFAPQPDAMSSSAGGAALRSGVDALPFGPPSRPTIDPTLDTSSAVLAGPSSSGPAWLKSRMGPPSTVTPPAAPAAVPWSPALDSSAVPPAPRSSPQAASSPWALGPPSSAVVAASAVALPPLVTPRGPGSSGLPNSAGAASDAAADVQSRAPAPPVVSRSLPPTPAPSEKAARTPGEVLELLWYDEGQVPRMRAWWEELVTDLDFEPSDPRRDLGAEDPDKARERHNVFGIISDGEVVNPATIPRVVSAAVNDKGRFTPPLTLMGGELRFPFDEVETLRATIMAATPVAGTDKRLKETLDSMTELLKTPYLQGSTGVVEKLTRDLRDQFRDANRALPAGYLDGHVERFLLEQRRYSIRKVFGGEFIRALLGTPGPEGGAPTMLLPVYLPKHLDQSLPMVVSMKVRLIAEAHLQQDLYETSPYALRVVALGRSFQLEARRAGVKGDSER